MANLTNQQIKDSYQSVLTTSETSTNPTTGTLQNGKGTAITALGVSGTVTATKLVPTGNVTAGNGMYLPTTNVLALSTAGSERMRIDASGNFMLGTSTADIFGRFDERYATLAATGATDNIALNITSGATAGRGAQVYMGQGTTRHLTISANATESSIGTTSNTPLKLQTNDTERMRIDASGNVGVGSTDTSIARLLVNRLNATQDQPVFAWTDAQDNTGYMAIRSATETGESTGGASLFADGGLHFGRLVTGAFSERMRITSDASAYLRLASGTGGIQFNGDTSASNALDDYEEGTFDFGIAFGGSSTGVTYANRQGKYTKIGNQVTVTGYIVLTSKGAQVGDANITGLPFTIFDATSNFTVPSLRLSNVSFADVYTGFGVVNETRIVLEEVTVAGVMTSLNEANFANDSSIMISMTYFTS